MISLPRVPFPSTMPLVITLRLSVISTRLLLFTCRVLIISSVLNPLVTESWSWSSITGILGLPPVSITILLPIRPSELMRADMSLCKNSWALLSMFINTRIWLVLKKLIFFTVPTFTPEYRMLRPTERPFTSLNTAFTCMDLLNSFCCLPSIITATTKISRPTNTNTPTMTARFFPVGSIAYCVKL